MSQSVIYLDHAAATPVDPAVLAAMQPYFSESFHNPSAVYLTGRAAKDVLEGARQSVAEELGARAGEIYFTAGATEANNLAIAGVMSQFPDAKVLASAIEHPSVLEPAKRFSSESIPVDEHGMVQIDTLKDLIADDVALISVIYANNEIGTVQPLRRIADLVTEVRADRLSRGVDLPLYLHTDAAQAANYLDMHVARLGVDLMTVSAAKTYGPKQVGCLFVRAGIPLTPVVLGGGQEFGLRSGTENVAGAVGLAKALNIASVKKKAETARLSALQGQFIKQIAQLSPDIIIHGHTERRLPNNIAFSLPLSGAIQDGETALMMLDERGIQVATGAACGASKDGPSHVLLATGVPTDVAERSLRVTMGRSTTETDMQRLFETLKEISA